MNVYNINRSIKIKKDFSFSNGETKFTTYVLELAKRLNKDPEIIKNKVLDLEVGFLLYNVKEDPQNTGLLVIPFPEESSSNIEVPLNWLIFNNLQYEGIDSALETISGVVGSQTFIYIYMMTE